MSKVLIFGVSGFVGQYLIREFMSQGYIVHGSDIDDTKNVKDCVFHVCDLLNYSQVLDLISRIKPTMIINLAAISSVGLSWKYPQKTMEINVRGSLNILEAIKELKLNTKIMFVGSSEEYIAQDTPMNESVPLNANNPYGISKVTQERFAQLYRENYGMKIYCVRPFNHTGVGQKDSFVIPSFCKQVAKIDNMHQSGKIVVGNVNIKRDFSDVRDIVRAYRLIIESDNCNRVYNIGSGKAYSLEDILKYIISLSNQDIEIEIDLDRYRPTDSPIISCDYSALKNELGWEPQYDILETIQDMYYFYKNN